MRATTQQEPQTVAPCPDLASYDVIVANISGGKDSQTMLRALIREADRQGVPRSRIVAVFADLGPQDEWAGTEELARYHALHYRVRFEVVWRRVPYPEGTVLPAGVTPLRVEWVNGKRYRQQTLSEYIEYRGRWPGPKQRYCTSDAKRGPIHRLFTRLCNEVRPSLEGRTRVRVLNVMGMRAQESPKRAEMTPFTAAVPPTNDTMKYVDEWLPIHEMTIDQVWDDIRRSHVRYHPVYDQGMPRLSCRFCFLASESALVCAARLDPEGARERAAMEARMGHTMRDGKSFLTIIEKAQSGPAGPAEDWAA